MNLGDTFIFCFQVPGGFKITRNNIFWWQSRQLHSYVIYFLTNLSQWPHEWSLRVQWKLMHSLLSGQWTPSWAGNLKNINRAAAIPKWWTFTKFAPSVFETKIQNGRHNMWPTFAKINHSWETGNQECTNQMLYPTEVVPNRTVQRSVASKCPNIFVLTRYPTYDYVHGGVLD